jgi:hypothetical protein
VTDPADEQLISPYETSHEVEVPLGVGQNPTADVFVVDLQDPFSRGRRAKSKVVFGDGPRAKERIAPVDPIIG